MKVGLWRDRWGVELLRMGNEVLEFAGGSRNEFLCDLLEGGDPDEGNGEEIAVGG